MESARSLPAKLTRAGVELLERTDAGVGASEQTLMSDLSAEQRREFRRILAALGSS